MATSRYIDLLQHIPGSEYSRLVKFAAAASKKAATPTLIRLSTDQLRKYPRKRLTPSYLTTTIKFKNEKDIFSDAVKVLERYLLFRHSGDPKKDLLAPRTGVDTEAEKALTLLAIYERLGLGHHYNRALNRLRKAVSKHPGDPEAHYTAYRLALIEAHAYSTEMHREPDPGVEQAIIALDRFYVSSRLKLYCEILNRRALLNATDEIKYPLLLPFNKLRPVIKEARSVQLYHSLYRMLETWKDKYFEDYLQTLLANWKGLSKAEALGLFTYGINFCSLKIQQEESRYLTKVWDLYMHMHRNELLLAEGQISPWQYKNMVEVGLRLKHFDTTRELIDHYKKHLPNEYSFMAAYTSMVYSFRATKQYANVARFLTQLDKEFSNKKMDITLRISVRKYQVMLGLTLDDESMVSIASKSLKQLLRRKSSVSESHKSAFSAFLSIANRIMLLSLYKAPVDYKELREDVLKRKDMSERNWMLKLLESKGKGLARAKRSKPHKNNVK